MFMIYALEINPTTFPPSRFANLASVLSLVIPLLTLGGAIIFLAMLLFGGFTIITAEGNQENITNARKIITFAVIGLVVIIFSFLIVKLIGIVLNINLPL